MTQIPGRKLKFTDIDWKPQVTTRLELINHLIRHNKFEQLAPNTLIYKDDRDVITVIIDRAMVFVYGDGPHVVKTWDIIQIPQGEYELYWENILQKILDKF